MKINKQINRLKVREKVPHSEAKTREIALEPVDEIDLY